jgi:hypothetical protein
MMRFSSQLVRGNSVDLLPVTKQHRASPASQRRRGPPAHAGGAGFDPLSSLPRCFPLSLPHCPAHSVTQRDPLAVPALSLGALAHSKGQTKGESVPTPTPPRGQQLKSSCALILSRL